MQGMSDINSPLVLGAVQSLPVRLWDAYLCTGVSLHVFGRYLTKHLSGNLRCWYSCYPLPPPLPPHPPHAQRFLGKGSVFEVGRRGCLI